MSVILKRINCAHLTLVKNGILNVTAFYSRRSNSKNSDSAYKVVKSKIGLDDDLDLNDVEGGTNWELFAPRGNRFYMPGLLGPAWQSTTTILPVDIDLEKFIDFKSKDQSKFHINSKLCPVLLRNNLHEIFPAPEVFAKGPIAVIIISNLLNLEEDNSAKNFVLVAREMCSRLRQNGYWADFMNPFSGRPFYSYSSGRNLLKIDNRFQGIDMKLENRNDCLIISSTKDIADGFSGSIFTNGPNDLMVLDSILNN